MYILKSISAYYKGSTHIIIIIITTMAPLLPKMKEFNKSFSSYLPVRTVPKCEHIYCLPIKFSMKLTIKVKKARKPEQHSDKPTYLFDSIK